MPGALAVRVHHVSLLFAASSAILVACSSTHGSDGDGVDGVDSVDLGVACTPSRPSFSTDVAPIFMGNCNGEECHGAPGYAQLVGATLHQDACNTDMVDVQPGSLEKSYLMRKLTGVGMCPMTQKMPPGAVLTSSEIQTVADWICEGAPNN